MFSKGTPKEELGATKNRFELAKALTELGWEVSILGSRELGLSPTEINVEVYGDALKNFLLLNADKFDVVLYDFDALPYDRNLFNRKTLFVGRPALLVDHFKSIKVPIPLIEVIKNYVRPFFKRRSNIQKVVNYKTLQQCDLIQVQNSLDKELLIKKGMSGDKIVIIPNGISNERMQDFSNAYFNRADQDSIKFVFVGTFDYRKGMTDIIWLFKKLTEKYSDCSLKLLGTKGLFRTAEEVYSFFPKKLQKRIEVIPDYKTNELPGLLEDCHIGIFPSYLESFGYGALEMMAAGIPTLTYCIPGPCDFVPKELQIAVGDKKRMLKEIVKIVEDKALRKDLSLKVNTIAKEYSMDKVGNIAHSYYLDFKNKLLNS
mgnify:CR=1 FL=1